MMKKVAFILVILSVVSPAEFCEIACQRIYEPVCGSDGITYSNLCELKATKCITKSNIHVLSEGECIDEGAEIDASSKCQIACQFEYEPICGSDGKTYNNLCLMEANSCLKKTPIEPMHQGECGEGVDVELKAGDCLHPCQLTWDPVCASNGLTFSNQCELESYNCLTRSLVFVVHKGICQSTKD